MNNRFLIAVAAALLVAAPCQAQSTPARAELELVSLDGTRQVIPRDSLARLPQHEIRGKVHDGPEHTWRGPSLADVVALTGIPTDRVRGKLLRLAVVALARDDYAVVYSLGEVSTGLSGRRSIVVLTRDGQPLDEKDGPLRIVVEGDHAGARWIRQLSRLSVVEVKSP